MISKRLPASLVCAVLLSACAAPALRPISPEPIVSIDAVMTAADTALRGGNTGQAYSILKGATVTFPTDKAPWLRMAQLRFESNSYGEAIVNAQEALARDRDDMLAQSIVVVSGLRVASKGMAEMTRKKKLSGSARSEAQDLAKLLRSSLGEEVLVPGKR